MSYLSAIAERSRKELLRLAAAWHPAGADLTALVAQQVPAATILTLYPLEVKAFLPQLQEFAADEVARAKFETLLATVYLYHLVVLLPGQERRACSEISRLTATEAGNQDFICHLAIMLQLLVSLTHLRGDDFDPDVSGASKLAAATPLFFSVVADVGAHVAEQLRQLQSFAAASANERP